MHTSFTTTILVDSTPEQAFAAINNARGWWSEEIAGATDQVGANFHYHFRDVHRCTIQIRELVLGTRVVWHVLDNYFSFTTDKAEWKGTELHFEIVRRGEATEVKFTHAGLVPEYECYSACSEGWRTYIDGSLAALIATGMGRPNKGEAITASEQAAVGSAP
jgi:hypothetical protein